MISLIQPCDNHQFEKFSEGCTTGQVTCKCKVCGYEETRWPTSHLASPSTLKDSGNVGDGGAELSDLFSEDLW